MRVGQYSVGFMGVMAKNVTTPSGETKPIDATQLESEAQKLRQQGAQIVIGLSVLDRLNLRRTARKVKGVDLWVSGHSPQENKTASPVGNSYMIEAGDRGRNIGRIVFYETEKNGPFRDPIGEYQETEIP